MRLRHAQFEAQALLFDMDGTLVNSHAPMERAYRLWAQRYGLDEDAVLRASAGRRTIDSIRALAPAGVDAEADANSISVQERRDMEGVVEIPGAAALLAALPRGRWALVTSADRELATARMRAAGLPLPAVMVTAESVSRGKPSPDGYLLAAERLGIPAAATIVFEDAPAGLLAGHRAGATVIAVATTLDEAQLADEHWVPDHLGLRVRAAAHGCVLVADDARP
jgi:sugar-phosphatase